MRPKTLDWLSRFRASTSWNSTASSTIPSAPLFCTYRFNASNMRYGSRFVDNLARFLLFVINSKTSKPWELHKLPLVLSADQVDLPQRIAH